jgi:hypothetical protein
MDDWKDEDRVFCLRSSQMKHMAGHRAPVTYVCATTHALYCSCVRLTLLLCCYRSVLLCRTLPAMAMTWTS